MLTILADRYLSNKAAISVLVTCIVVLCWSHRNWLATQAREAQDHRTAVIIGCLAVFAAIGALVGVIVTQAESGHPPPECCECDGGKSRRKHRPPPAYQYRKYLSDGTREPLPITVQPNTRVYVLRLNPDCLEMFGIDTIEAGKQEVIWPNDKSRVTWKSKNAPMEMIGRIELTNPGSKTITAVSLSIAEVFYEPKEVEVRTRVTGKKEIALDLDPEGKW